jgi:hypothetical protein
MRIRNGVRSTEWSVILFIRDPCPFHRVVEGIHTADNNPFAQPYIDGVTPGSSECIYHIGNNSAKAYIAIITEGK